MESFIPPDPCLCTVLLEHLRITTTFPYLRLWKAFHNNKRRSCPLWKDTVKTLTTLVAGRSPQSPVFLSCRGQALTRFGIHTLVERHVRTASQPQASMRNKRVSPHCLRHYADLRTMPTGVASWPFRAEFHDVRSA
jgi:integrase